MRTIYRKKSHKLNTQQIEEMQQELFQTRQALQKKQAGESLLRQQMLVDKTLIQLKLTLRNLQQIQSQELGAVNSCLVQSIQNMEEVLSVIQRRAKSIQSIFGNGFRDKNSFLKENRLNHLQDKLQEHLKKLKQAETTIKMLQIKLQSTETQLREIQSKYAVCLQEAVNSKTTVGKLQSQIDNKNKNISALSVQLSVQKQNNERATKLIFESRLVSQKHNAFLTGKIDELEKEKHKISNTQINLNMKIQDLSRALKDKENQYKESLEQLQQLKKQCGRLRSTFQSIIDKENTIKKLQKTRKKAQQETNEQFYYQTIDSSRISKVSNKQVGRLVKRPSSILR